MSVTDLKRCTYTVNPSIFLTRGIVDSKTTEFWTGIRHIESTPKRSRRYADVSPPNTVVFVSYFYNIWYEHSYNDGFIHTSVISQSLSAKLTKLRLEVIKNETINLYFGVLALTDILGKDICSVILLA